MYISVETRVTELMLTAPLLDTVLLLVVVLSVWILYTSLSLSVITQV